MEVVSLTIIVSLLVIIFTAIAITSRQKGKTHHTDGIPGPKVDDPKVGHLPSITKSGGLIPFVKSLHEKYGSVAKFYLGQDEVITVNDPKLLKKTLKIGDRPIDMFKFLEPLLGTYNGQIMNGYNAANLRKLLGNAFGHQVLQQKYKDIHELASNIVTDWDTKFANKNVVVQLQQELLKFGMRAIAKAALSANLGNVDMDKFNHSYDIVLSGLFDKQYGTLPDNRESEFQECLQYLRSVYAILISSRRNQTETVKTDNQLKDLLDILLTSHDPETGKPFSEEMIFSHMAGYMLAAYHTSAISMAWTLYELTQNPHIQTKLHEEVDRVLGKSTPAQSDLENLTYLTQVIKESMRVHTPGPFASRLTEYDTPVGSYTLKKGTILFYPLSAIHKNETYWPNPEHFDPERFNEKNVKSIVPNSFCPFGIGARICPGDRFAMMEMRLMLSLLLQHFSFELAMKKQDVIPEERFVMMAKQDIQVRIKRR